MSEYDDYELTPEQEKGLLRFLAGSKSISEVLASSGPDWLIEGWLVSSATMVDGTPESGKSSLVASMAAAVANGEAWLDVPVTTDRTGPVVIIATDPSDRGQWANKGRDLKVADDRWELIAFTPERWEYYADLAEQLDSRMLVFDNITSGIEGPINEADPSCILGPLTRIADAGTPVVVIAHSDKSGSRDPMGPTAYKAWRRHGIHVKRIGDRRTLKRSGNHGSWSDVIVNGTPIGAAVEYRLADGEANKPNRSPETMDRNGDVADWVVENCQGMTRNATGAAIAETFSGSAGSYRTSLSSGALSRLLKRTGEGGSTVWTRTK
ncbi:MAG: AAA family ATPase [Isosphaeraceae bacterium]